MPACGAPLIAHEEIEEQDVDFDVVIVTVVVGVLARLVHETLVLGEF